MIKPTVRVNGQDREAHVPPAAAAAADRLAASYSARPTLAPAGTFTPYKRPRTSPHARHSEWSYQESQRRLHARG